jgi:hypothetical protein
MTKREQILEKYPEDNFVFADGLDEAIIGVDDDNMLIVYSTQKVLDIIHNETEVDEKDIEEWGGVEEAKRQIALEHFYYNIKGTKGNRFPIYIDDDFWFNEV